jgi:hypothetical protein
MHNKLCHLQLHFATTTALLAIINVTEEEKKDEKRSCLLSAR